MNKLLSTLILLVVFLGFGISCASAANVVSLNPQTVDLRPGSSQSVQIVMDKVPTGLSGFNITISISDPVIANITAVSPPDWAGVSATSSVPANSVWIKAANFGQIHAGDTNVSLGTINITGIKAGTSDINIVPTEIDDNNGDLINPSVIKSKINVVVTPVNISFIPQKADLIPGSSQNFQIVMDKVPASGLAGSNITISVLDPSIANITAVSPPIWAGVSGTSTVPSSSVWIKAANFGQVHAGDTNVSLGTIALTGIKAGTSEINIVPTQIDDNNGDPINPVVTKGQVNVAVIPINISFIPQKTQIVLNSLQNFQIVMNKVPNGLSGFNITVSILDPTIAEITSASTPIWNGITVNSTSAVPSSSVWIKGVNFGQIHAGDTNVSLGNVNLTGKKEGTTNINIRSITIEDDNGDPINVQMINCELKVVNLPVFPGYKYSPTDPNNDGLYEDINGNGRLDFADVVAFYNNMTWITQNGLVAYFDFNHNGRIDFNDVVKIYIMH